MGKVTLSDIARETGFSINTISHALHDKPDISETTKELIVRTANEMGYIANASAGALRSGKSRSAAIIVGDISNPHFSIIIKEMEGRLRSYGYTAFILNTDENEELEREAIISAISKNVDGILICPVQKTHKNIDFIHQKGIPYVLFGRHFDDRLSSYVVCDDVHGGYAAAEHLLKRNHKKLLFLNAPRYISSSRERLEGARQAVSAYHLPAEALTVEETNIGGERKGVLNLLQRNLDCTGLICFSDLIAMQACHTLKELGKRVPEDVSVIGFDNIVSKFAFPLMLTSVTSSKTKLSVKVVDTLMDIIENRTDDVQQHILSTRVITRESTRAI